MAKKVLQIGIIVFVTLVNLVFYIISRNIPWDHPSYNLLNDIHFYINVSLMLILGAYIVFYYIRKDIRARKNNVSIHPLAPAEEQMQPLNEGTDGQPKTEMQNNNPKDGK